LPASEIIGKTTKIPKTAFIDMKNQTEGQRVAAARLRQKNGAP